MALSERGEVAQRERWAAYLEGRLEELIEDSLLLDREGEARAQALLSEYVACEDDRSVCDVLSDFRVELARLLAREDGCEQAIEVLGSEDLAPGRAASVLEELKNLSDDPEERSRYRNARAEHLFREGDPEGARVELSEDIEDLGVPEPRRSLSALKLEAMADEKTPDSWVSRMIPQELIRDRAYSSGITTLVTKDLGDSSAHAVAKTMVAAMSRYEYHNRAIALARELCEANHGGTGYEWNARTCLAQALREAGRYDQAVECLQDLARDSKGGVVSDQALEGVVQIYSQAGMPEEALEAARERRERATDSRSREKAERAYLRRLVHMGELERALREAAGPEEQINLLRSELSRCPVYKERSVMRHRLAAILLGEGRPEEAQTIMEDERIEHQASPAERKLAEDKIKELQKIISEQ